MIHLRQFFTLALLLATVALAAHAQQLPIDTALATGTLPNGLTYYVRHNDTPPGRAHIMMVLKAGSTAERDSERGLAHLLEHLAFAGSTHFPGATMESTVNHYTSAQGGDYNAYTSLSQTQFYFSNFPCTSMRAVDSLLAVMRDIASDLSLDDASIARQRDIVEQERRESSNFMERFYRATLSTLLPGCTYGERAPIGLSEVIENATPATVRPFYERWYRPDLLALIVVGDIDRDQVVDLIKQHFASMPAAPAGAPQPPVDRAVSHKGVKYVTYSDHEATGTMAYLMFKHAVRPVNQRNTLQAIHDDIVEQLTQTMLMSRLDEMAARSTAPFEYAQAYDNSYLVSQAEDAFTLAAMVKDGRIQETLDSLTTAVARVRQHGFLAAELENARHEVASRYSIYRSEAARHESGDYVQEYLQHYIEHDYIPGVEDECTMKLEAIDQVTLDDCNRFIDTYTGPNDVVALCTGPEQRDWQFPAEKDVKSHFKRCLSAATTPYVYTQAQLDRPLLRTTPTPGTVTATETEDDTHITTLTLSNGVVVQLLPTTYKQNEVLFNATSEGGIWSYEHPDVVNVRALDEVIEESRLGGFTQQELMKKLAGHQLQISFSLNDPTEQLNGTCTTADIELLLQLCYLYFTDVTPDREAFDTY